MNLINVLDDITKDFENSQYQNSKSLSRRFVFRNGCVILVSLSRNNKLGEVGYLLPDDYKLSEIKNIPKLKGLEQRLSGILENGINKQYLFFSQLTGYDPRIYTVVMQDIIDKIDVCFNFNTLVIEMKDVLTKWSTFFQNEKEMILSENKQQGLYGELYVLEKLIAIKGERAILCWTGYNAEAHDFYIDTDALEVKSSSVKGPDVVFVNNEYQLDDNGIIGKLYLMYIKIKKSVEDGEILPEIVDRILMRLDADIRKDFIDKLFKVGYIYKWSEWYTLHFKVRDESCYEVINGFPRITLKSIPKGIGNVTYTVSLDACAQFQILVEKFYGGVNK